MNEIEKTLNDYSLLHSFEVLHKVSVWNQTRLVVVKGQDGSDQITMRTLTLCEKFKTMFNWRPTSEYQLKALLPKDAPKELVRKITNIFKDLGVYKPRENLQGRHLELLTTACSCGNAETVRKILQISIAREVVNTPNEQKQTLLMLAAINGHKDVVKELLKAGADPSLKDQNQKTAFALANKHGHSDICKMLFKADSSETVKK